MTIVTSPACPLRRVICLVLLTAGMSLCGAAIAETATMPGALPEVLDHQGFHKHFARSGNTYIGGQPDAQGMQRLADIGVAAIVSLRTDEENETVGESGFDEAEAARAKNIPLHTIPLQDEASFSPAAVQQFIDIYDAHDGNVYLHCASGRRASYLWTAFLIRHKGFSLTQAQQHAAAINFGKSPLEGLLGEPLQWQYAPLDASQATSDDTAGPSTAP